jgi:hypothetical protein
VKLYIAFLFQMILWSIFYLAEWYSHKDGVQYKYIMFLVIFYLAFILTKKIVESKKLTLFITSFSLSCFFVMKVLVENIVKFI